MQQPTDEKCGEARPSDDVQSAWVSIQRAAQRLQDRVEDKLKAAGLPPLAWYSVLWSLEIQGGSVRPRDLGQSLFLERYSVSRLLDRIEGEGLIRREDCPDDARGQLIVLTDAGQAMRKKMWEVHGPVMREGMRALDDGAARALKAALDGLG